MITATNPPRFLIIQTAFIGDVILATALLEQLHLAFPDAVLDVLVRKGNEGLLANHPFLNEVLIWHKKETKYRDLWRLLRTIRARKYDAVLNLQRYGTMGLLTALSGAKTTVGFDKNPFSRLFTHQVEHRFEPGVHEVDRNTGFAASTGNRANSYLMECGPNCTRHRQIMKLSKPIRASRMYAWHLCRSGLPNNIRLNAG